MDWPLTYHALGRKKESDAALAEFIAKYRADAAYQVAEIYAFRGEADRAFEWLERAYAQRDGGLIEMKVVSFLKSLKRETRTSPSSRRCACPSEPWPLGVSTGFPREAPSTAGRRPGDSNLRQLGPDCADLLPQPHGSCLPYRDRG